MGGNGWGRGRQGRGRRERGLVNRRNVLSEEDWVCIMYIQLSGTSAH